MGQASAKLRAIGGGDIAHWCPGCEQVHVLPIGRGGWTFDGDLTAPTCTPSFLHRWNDGAVARVCHYILTAGVLNYCGDCTHAMAGKAVLLPNLPPEWRDP